MKKLTIFSQFFKGYGPVYLLGVLILITINILFLYVPRLIGEAINTLYYGKEGLTTYSRYFLC